MARWWLAGLLCAAAGRPQLSHAGSPSASIELWVDGSAPPGGAGTADRPLQTLEAALAQASGSPSRIHLATGVYRGSFQPADLTEIDGRGAVVLASDGAGTVLAPRGRLSLRHLLVQGGSVGIEAVSQVSLTDVGLSGQRRVGVHLRSGTLTAQAASFSAEVSEVDGLKLEGSARATLAGCQFSGPFRRAVEVSGSSSLEILDSAFDGTVSGVHQVGGTVAIRRTRFSGHRGPAIFCAGGSLRLVDVDAHGHEYALQCGEAAEVRALRFSSVGAERAGVALYRAQGWFEEITTVDSGSFGAIQLVNATLELRRFRLQHAQGYGLLARHSQISLSDGTITDVVDSDGSAGEGIHLRGSQGSIDSVSILRTAGPGLLAAADSSVRVGDLWIERCRWAGVVAETFARIRGMSWTIRHCAAPALAVPDAAEIDVDVLSSEGNAESPFWVECARDAKLRLSRAQVEGLARSGSACVQIAR